MFAVLGVKEIPNMNQAKNPAGRNCEVEKLCSLVGLVDLPLEAGPDVEIPDDGRPGTSYGAAYHAEVDQSGHQQTLLQWK